LVTHHLEEAETLCDRIAIMHHGKILTCGPVQQIKNQVSARRHYEFTVANLPSTSLLELEKIPGVVNMHCSQNDHDRVVIQFLLADDRQALPVFTKQIISQGASIESMETHDISLEDAFVHLVNGNATHA
jgi:ABC-2 type transport system ATP-binding protein